MSFISKTDCWLWNQTPFGLLIKYWEILCEKYGVINYEKNNITIDYKSE